MRIVAWNCAMALHRKVDALMGLRPDLAIVSEAAEPRRLVARAPSLAEASLVWVGKNPNKGLLVAGFGTTRPAFSRHRHDRRLHWMAPVAVSGLPGVGGPVHLLGVWAQNATEGNLRKDNPGFLQRALRRCCRRRPGWCVSRGSQICLLRGTSWPGPGLVSRGRAFGRRRRSPALGIPADLRSTGNEPWTGARPVDRRNSVVRRPLASMWCSMRSALSRPANRVAADVDHVAQQVAEHALRHRAAEMDAEAEPRELRLLLAPSVHRELPQEQEPAVGDLVAPRPDGIGNGISAIRRDRAGPARRSGGVPAMARGSGPEGGPA